MIPIGKVIRRLREERGYSRPELAERSGVDKDYLKFIETERRPNPAYHYVFALADALGVTVDHIYCLVNELPVEDPGKDEVITLYRQLGIPFQPVARELLRTLVNTQRGNLVVSEQHDQLLIDPPDPREDLEAAFQYLLWLSSVAPETELEFILAHQEWFILMLETLPGDATRQMMQELIHAAAQWIRRQLPPPDEDEEMRAAGAGDP